MKNNNNLAILASGNASNLEPIFNAIKNNKLDLNIKLLISNNTNSIALQKANKFEITNYLINNNNSSNVNKAIYKLLKEHNCQYVLLSGYMKKLDSLITNNFIVINTHPALLPSYGGAGMYGRYVHKAVINNNEKYSGITIHYVNENYDEGKIILQEQIELSKNESVNSLEQKVKDLEKVAIIKALDLCLK
jgi:phosphoribosylglycinamide formyltransferase-1